MTGDRRQQGDGKQEPRRRPTLGAGCRTTTGLTHGRREERPKLVLPKQLAARSIPSSTRGGGVAKLNSYAPWRRRRHSSSRCASLRTWCHQATASAEAGPPTAELPWRETLPRPSSRIRRSRTVSLTFARNQAGGVNDSCESLGRRRGSPCVRTGTLGARCAARIRRSRTVSLTFARN